MPSLSPAFAPTTLASSPWAGFLPSGAASPTWPGQRVSAHQVPPTIPAAHQDGMLERRAEGKRSSLPELWAGVKGELGKS